MIKIQYIIVFITILIVGNTTFSQTIDPNYTVATWHGFRSAAFSFTFDDGSPNQYTLAVPIFNEFDFKLTWFIDTGSWGWSPNWTALQNAANQGHEIASHTVSHTNFSEIDDSPENIELRDSKNTIEAHITGQKCVTMAYPYCVPGTQTIAEQYYIAGRTCSGSIISKNPSNFMTLSSIICGPQGPVETTTDFIKKAESAAKLNGWCVYLLHGIDGDGGWSSISSDTLRKTLEFHQANQDKYWISTFGNVARYIKERNAVSITELSVQDTSITVEITDALNDTIYNQPLTLRRQLPDGWPSAKVLQNGWLKNMQIVEVDSVQYIQFDAVPDSGNVIISKSNATGIRSHSNIFGPLPVLKQNYPNPFNPTTMIIFALMKSEHAIVKIFDINGREISTLLDKNMPAGQHSIEFNGDGLASGTYYYELKVNDYSLSRKMLLLK
jgi:oligosaccharide reducing-end xylanase